MGDLNVSVVIPSFNRAHLIGRALQSVLREIGPSDEIILVDDGSVDDTERAVAEMGDRRIRYIWQANGGAGAARNRGISEARKDLLAFLDSDDEWLPGKLTLQRRFMAARPDVLFCFTDYVSDFDGSRRPRTLEFWRTDQHPWQQVMGNPIRYSSIVPLPAAELPEGIQDLDVYSGDIYRLQMHSSYLQINCMLVRREAAGDAMHFTEGTATWEDWECFGRLARRGHLVYLDYVGAVQHKHAGPRVTDADWIGRAEARLAVLQNVWGSDPEFLSKHGDEYHALVHEVRVLKIRALIVLGKTREARQEIRKLPRVPISYKAISRLPGKLVTSLVNLRRALRSIDALRQVA